MNRKEQNSILERHNRAMVQILKRFRNMITQASAPLPESGAIEQAAVNRWTMETESAALITEIQGLLALNREIKALWMRGPIRKPGEDDGREAEIDRKAEAVAKLYDQVQAMRDIAIKQAAQNKGQGKGGDDAAAGGSA
ncbi:hypothetical protein F5B20DRAFT_559738 [Whalleya microplaca]|nr:hypothetical protein F5B20DRAFT_559738 [Whalleya microplaca]